MYCRNCGKELVGADAFCQSCGARQDMTSFTTVNPTSADQSFHTEQQSVYTSTTPNKKKFSFVPVIAISLVVVLVLTGVLTHGFGIFGSKEENPLAITLNAINSYFDLNSVHLEEQLIRDQNSGVEKFSGSFSFGDSFNDSAALEDGEWEYDDGEQGIHMLPYSTVLYNGLYASRDTNYDSNEKQTRIMYTFDENSDNFTEYYSFYLFPTIWEYAAPWDSVIADKNFDEKKALQFMIAKYMSVKNGSDETDTAFYEEVVQQLNDRLIVFIYGYCGQPDIRNRFVSSFILSEYGELTTYEYELDTEKFFCTWLSVWLIHSLFMKEKIFTLLNLDRWLKTFLKMGQ
jgi:hypothetical protein